MSEPPAVVEPEHRTPYFGEHWDAPIVDNGQQVPTPVGEPCIYCTIEVAEGDQGTFMGAIFDAEGPPDSSGRMPWVGRMVPAHRECGVRSAMGPWSHHENGVCTCRTDPEKPPVTAWRQEGLNWIAAMEGRYTGPSVVSSVSPLQIDG